MRPAERAQHIGIRRRAERSVKRNLVRRRQALHGIETTAADDADLCLLQRLLLQWRCANPRLYRQVPGVFPPAGRDSEYPRDLCGSSQAFVFRLSKKCQARALGQSVPSRAGSDGGTPAAARSGKRLPVWAGLTDCDKRLAQTVDRAKKKEIAPGHERPDRSPFTTLRAWLGQQSRTWEGFYVGDSEMGNCAGEHLVGNDAALQFVSHGWIPTAGLRTWLKQIVPFGFMNSRSGGTSP